MALSFEKKVNRGREIRNERAHSRYRHAIPKVKCFHLVLKANLIETLRGLIAAFRRHGWNITMRKARLVYWTAAEESTMETQRSTARKLNPLAISGRAVALLWPSLFAAVLRPLTRFWRKV